MSGLFRGACLLRTRSVSGSPWSGLRCLFRSGLASRSPHHGLGAPGPRRVRLTARHGPRPPCPYEPDRRQWRGGRITYQVFPTLPTVVVTLPAMALIAASIWSPN